MRHIIYQHDDSSAMTLEMLQWLASTYSHNCTSLSLAANCTLEEEASNALVQSVAARTLQSLGFTEIYFTPQQLEALLSMPALTELSIWGGESSDWNGPTYVWDTLEAAHVDVLVNSPHAQRLRILKIGNQNFSNQTGLQLRAALPNLETLNVEGELY
jgi:hypothetical protein